MNSTNISEFFKGWFIGDFQPAVMQTRAFEVGFKEFSKGESEPRHKQLIATEITLVVSGIVLINGNKFRKGDIVTVQPNETVDFVALTDAQLVCVKTPSIPSDKIVE